MNRFTRSILLALVAVAAFAVPTLTHAQSAPDLAYKPVKFRKAVSAAYVLQDSTTLAGNASSGAAKLDTTAAIYIGDMRTQGPISSTGAITATNAMRLVLNCSSATASQWDTLFVLPQFSANGTVWNYSATYTNQLITSGYPTTTAFSAVFTQDSDAAANTVGNAHLWRYVRFILRPDGNNAAVAKVNSAFLIYDSSTSAANLRPQTP